MNAPVTHTTAIMMPPVTTQAEVLLVHVTWVIMAMEQIVQVYVDIQTILLLSDHFKQIFSQHLSLRVIVLTF
jgi:hypothetical protein